MLNELIPTLEWPVAVGRAEAADEVLFKRLDGMLGRDDAMIRWFYKLPFAILLLEEGLDRFGALIVGDIECRLVYFVF